MLVDYEKFRHSLVCLSCFVRPPLHAFSWMFLRQYNYIYTFLIPNIIKVDSLVPVIFFCGLSLLMKRIFASVIKTE